MFGMKTKQGQLQITAAKKLSQVNQQQIHTEKTNDIVIATKVKRTIICLLCIPERSNRSMSLLRMMTESRRKAKSKKYHANIIEGFF